MCDLQGPGVCSTPSEEGRTFFSRTRLVVARAYVENGGRELLPIACGIKKKRKTFALIWNGYTGSRPWAHELRGQTFQDQYTSYCYECVVLLINFLGILTTGTRQDARLAFQEIIY